MVKDSNRKESYLLTVYRRYRQRMDYLRRRLRW